MAVGHHRRTAVLDIGGRESRRMGDADNVAALAAPRIARCIAGLDFREQVEDASGRLAERALPDERYQEIDLAVGLVERTPVRQEPVEEHRCASAGLCHIDMRIGPIADHCRGICDHLWSHVGIVVEACDEGHLLTDHGANAPHQRAFAVFVMLDDHCAMQIEVDGIEGAGRLQIVYQPAGDRLVGIPFDVGARWGRAPAERDQFMPLGAESLDSARDRDIQTVNRRKQFRAAQIGRPDVGALEIHPRRLLRREGVRLMLESGDGDAGHIGTLVWWNGGWRRVTGCS
jgi:hypothetical protein